MKNENRVLIVPTLEIAYNCGPTDGAKSVLMITSSKPGNFYEYSATYLDFSGIPMITKQFEGSQEADDDMTYFHLNGTDDYLSNTELN